MHVGKVYFGYERERNVVEAEIDGSAPLLWALDFNWDPMSSIVAQRRGGKVVVLDEIVLSQRSTYQACEELSGVFRETGLV